MHDGKAEADQHQRWASHKFDLFTGMSADPRLDARAFEVGFCIVQHVNARRGTAILSDDTISDKTGIPKRWVLRARSLLRETGWLRWERTRTANVYQVLSGPLNAVLDHQEMLKEERRERLSKKRERRPSRNATGGTSECLRNATGGTSRNATGGRTRNATGGEHTP
jgi:hypothetical protein